MANNRLILRTLNSPWIVPAPDLTKGSVLTHSEVDNNFIYLKGESIYSVDSSPSVITLNKVNGSSLTISLSGSTNTYTSGTTIVGNTIYFDRNDSLSAYTADLTSVLSGVTLTDGNGTTANGNSVNLGGTLTSNAIISGGGKNLELGTSTNLLNDIKINTTTGSETYSGGSLTNIELNTPTSFDRKVTDGDAVTLFEGYSSSLDLKATKPTLSGESRVYVTPQAVEITQTNTTTNKGGRLQLTSNSSDYTYTDGANITSQLFMSSVSTNVTITETGGGNSGLIIKPEESLLFTDNASLKLTPSATTFTDGRAITKGIEYAGDYSSGWTVNSLVTKGYVDSSSGSSGSSIYTANGTFGSGRTGTLTDTLSIKDSGGTNDVFKLNTNGEIIIANGGNTYSKFFTNGDVALGGSTIIGTQAGITLHRNTLVKGEGTGSSDNCFQVLNSGNNGLFKVFGDGTTIISGTALVGTENISLQGNTLIKGSDNSASTSGFKFIDSNNDSKWDFRNDGNVHLGQATTINSTVKDILTFKTSFSSNPNISLDTTTDTGVFIKFLNQSTFKWSIGNESDGTFRIYNGATSTEPFTISSSNAIEMTGNVSSTSTSSIAAFIAKGDGSSQDGYIQLNCRDNSHGIKLKSPPHSATASYTLTFPDDTGSNGQVLQTDGSGNLSWGSVGGAPSLNNGQIFVGNASNVATSVAMTGDVAITTSGVTTIQSDAVTYDKMQDVTQAAMLGNSLTVGGTVEEIPIVQQYLTTGANTGLLNETNNWDVNGEYKTTSTSLTGTFQGQAHYNGDYWFTAVDDNVWIRLIRG